MSSPHVCGIGNDNFYMRNANAVLSSIFFSFASLFYLIFMPLVLDFIQSPSTLSTAIKRIKIYISLATVCVDRLSPLMWPIAFNTLNGGGGGGRVLGWWHACHCSSCWLIETRKILNAFVPRMDLNVRLCRREECHRPFAALTNNFLRIINRRA